MTAYELVREQLGKHACKIARDNGRHLDAQCPAHKDQHPSLSMTAAADRVLLRCHRDCDIRDILAALELTPADLFDEPPRPGGAEPPISVYDYVNESGRILFQVVRFPGKRFRQRVKDPAAADGWHWGLRNTRRVIYRLPQVLAAVAAGMPVWVCEGEKDVHALEAAGLVATCNPGGAGMGWREEYTPAFRDAEVTIVADRDKAGEAYARLVARALRPVARSVRIVEAADGKDAADHLNAGYAISDFVETTPAERAGLPDLAPDLYQFLEKTFPAADWVIEGVLERLDRMILTGGEGRGKSLLIKQIAVAAASGLHPFSEPTDRKPVSVLYIDCENPEPASQRQFDHLAGVAALAGCSVVPGGLRIIHRPEGLDLSREDDAWLLERVTAHKPDLLCIGPLYRLHVVDANEETAARAIANALDAARLAAGCALLLEAHAPHEIERGRRVLRPAGSSLFLRWPELGYGLMPTGTEQDWDDGKRDFKLRQWRGPRGERACIPQMLRWSRDDRLWPWIPATQPSPR